MSKVLLIIGNGFDKSVGLPSSFSDFFNENRKKKDFVIDYLSLKELCLTQKSCFFSNVYEYVSNHKTSLFKEITFWEMLILNKWSNDLDLKWYNIEKILQENLCTRRKNPPFSYSENTMIESIKQFLSGINQNYTHFTNTLSINNEVELMNAIIVAYHSKTITNYRRIDKESILKVLACWELFLVEQLNIYENQFQVYLSSNVNDKYNILSNLKLSKILDEYKGQFNLLNFNYTEPKHERLDIYENVHGRLGANNIIFGIDSMSTIPGSLEYSFTKEYRKSHLFTRNPAKLTARILNDSVEEVIIYGHSLNEQDLSYFYSIFDYYNLDNENIDTRKKSNNSKPLSITYCFSIYDESKYEQIREESLKSITTLLSSYGNRNISSQQHKNYLLTKLLLQNRFRIKII